MPLPSPERTPPVTNINFVGFFAICTCRPLIYYL
jgi:hypothetical protein